MQHNINMETAKNTGVLFLRATIGILETTRNTK